MQVVLHTTARHSDVFVASSSSNGSSGPELLVQLLPAIFKTGSLSTVSNFTLNVSHDLPCFPSWFVLTGSSGRCWVYISRKRSDVPADEN